MYDFRMNIPFCDDEPRSEDSFKKSGLHPKFMQPMLNVITTYNVVLLIRASNPHYWGLLSDQYATKSMYVHTKSCSWGPMTGFVCANPFFHKKSPDNLLERDSQLHTLQEALCHSKYPVKYFSPIMITNDRVNDLIEKRLITPLSSIHEGKGQVSATHYGKTYYFQLIWQPQKLGQEGMWAVHYDNEKNPDAVQWTLKNILDACIQNATWSESITPPVLTAAVKNLGSFYNHLLNTTHVWAIVDPKCPLPWRNPKSASTADYDLFGIHPCFSHFAGNITLEARYLPPPASLPRWVLNPSSIKTYPSLYLSLSSDKQYMQQTHLESPLHSPTWVEHQEPLPHDLVAIARTPPRNSPSTQAAASLDFTSPTTASPITPSALQGHITSRELAVVAQLNNAIRYDELWGSSNLRLFHHGPDAHHPTTDEPDLPCVALIPCSKHAIDERDGAKCVRAVYIDTAAKLFSFYFWNIICQGYALTPGMNKYWLHHGLMGLKISRDVELSSDPERIDLTDRLMVQKQMALERELMVVSPNTHLKDIQRIWGGVI